MPAYLRWCDSSAQTNNATPAASSPKGCQAAWTSGEFNNSRYPGKNWTSAFTVASVGSTSTKVTSIKVNALEIMSGEAAPGSTTTSNMASAIETQINACTYSLAGNCQIIGYQAVRSGSTVTITASGEVGSLSSAYAPVITFTGSTVTTSSPARSGASPFTMTAFAGGVPGRFIRTNIVSGTTSYPFPGTSSKAATRTDCAGLTCTYAEEMTNFANWWSFYRTRMQMMKTSASIAFEPIGANYRVGYLSIDNNTSNDFLNVAPFNTTQKRAWYNKLFAANPDNSTPLRTALTTAGRLYAGKLNGSTLNGSTVTDPMEYSCQQNFTILSTDGYWNGGNGTLLDGSTGIGQQDGAEVRPYIDSAIASTTVVTPYSKLDRKETSTPGSVTTDYTRSVTTVSSTLDCGGAAATATCLPDNKANSSSKTRTWCIEKADPVDGSDQLRLDASGTSSNKIYASRGSSTSTNTPSGGSGCQTDADTGKTYCIFGNNPTSCPSNCVRVRSGNNLYACEATSVATGYTVTIQPQKATRTQTGATTSTDDVTSSYTSSVVTTNGVAAPATTSSVTTSSVNIVPATLSLTKDKRVPADGA